MVKDTIHSIMGTSTNWPSPVRSRWKSAASTAWLMVRPVVLSATTVGRYNKGMAVFTVAKGGLMYEASIGGQRFSYKAVQ